MKVRNCFKRSVDDELCASVESIVLWFDLVQRKPVVPPPDLAELWRSLAHAGDYQSW